jgi:putative nucleotidyltransferase with HDIG domain
MTLPRPLKQLPDETHRVLQTTMLILASLDEDLFAHSEQVARTLLALAPEGHEEEWYWAGLLHDIGKLASGYEIFRKRGALNQSERQLMQQHPIKGANLLREIGAPQTVIDGAEFHHEHWDGRGYPYQIRGEEIPLVARMLAVADAYAALTSDRPYRRACPQGQAHAEIRKNTGMQFDSQAIGKFFVLVSGGGWNAT